MIGWIRKYWISADAETFNSSFVGLIEVIHHFKNTDDKENENA